MGGLTGALAMLLFASTALAASHNPKGEYAGFKECPLNRVTITDCVLSVSGGGFFTIGKKTVPLVNPVTLQGGFEGEGEAVKFYGAENGDTLSKTPQPVPGGLLGIVAPTWWPKFIQDWFNKQINEGLTGVNATVELTGPTKGLTNVKLSTQNLLTRKGTALGLPAKIRLQNAILGSSCYLGSEKSPVQINFTTGKDGGIEGVVGKVEFNEEFTIITISGGKLVNNSFVAPGVNGCGGIFSFLIDPLVNSILGVPSGAGANTAVLEGKLQDANAEAVKASE
ncbi:MAG: hypothetical protein ACOYD4_09145 [Solirubrobacterales bacterium]